MIYRRKSKNSILPGGHFHLENEKSKTRVHGYGFGDFIKLRDEYGNVWRGSAERHDDGGVYYRFKTDAGAVLTGLSQNFIVTLRDQAGETWKGFID